MQAAETTAVGGATTGAITRRERAPLGFMANDLDELWRVSEMLAKAGIGIPDVLKGKPYDIQVILMTGHDLGLTFMQSMREVYVVKGKGFLSTSLKLGLILQSGLCEYWTEEVSTAQKCTIVTKRKGSPKEVRHTFTVEEARAADLFKNDVWAKYPAVMLSKRCGSQLADKVYPDVVRGMGTSDDEMLFEREVQGQATRVPATTAPPSPVVWTAPKASSPSAAAKATDAEVVPEHNPVTGEVKEEAPPASVAHEAQAPGGAPEAEVPASGLPAASEQPEDPWATEVEQLKEAIAGSKLRPELQALVPRISALPPAHMDAVRPLYTAKIKTLK